MLQQPTRIVILGAGYAGLLATMRMAGKLRREDVAITLVNASETFVERLHLHEYAAHHPITVRSLPKMLAGTGVSFVQGNVTRIEPAQHQVIVQTGENVRPIAYDYLVYALGSNTDLDRTPGVRANAYTLNTAGEHSVQALRAELPLLNQHGGRMLICGGGATGIEAAAEFAEAFPNIQVRLVTRGEFGSFRGQDVGTYMRQSLTQLGVTIQDHTSISEIADDHAVTSNGENIPFDLCLWTGGFIAPSLARTTGLAVNERGQILVDPFLRTPAHPEIYAIGDAATPGWNLGLDVRMSAFTALIFGAYGADSVTAAVTHKTLKPFSFSYVGQGIALGQHDAIAFGSHADDTPHAPYFKGELAARLRGVFAGVLHSFPLIEKRVPGSFYWVGKNRAANPSQPVTPLKPLGRSA